MKVRPRCEAPRRDMIYPMNYTPCRYVRISCLRGNPIAIFFIQVMDENCYMRFTLDLLGHNYYFILHSVTSMNNLACGSNQLIFFIAYMNSADWCIGMV